MTFASIQRLICRAALLDDKSAEALLRKELDQLPADNTKEIAYLLVAYAWVAPAEALAWQEQHGINLEIRNSPRLILEARQLQSAGAETLVAYDVLTALLPGSPEKLCRLQVRWLVEAINAPERILEDPQWFGRLGNSFLRARLWAWFPQQFWEQIKAQKALKELYVPEGQFVLNGRCAETDIPLLISLTVARRTYARGPYSEAEALALLDTLSALETHAPQELPAMLPAIAQSLSNTWGVWDGHLIARLLVVVARLEVEGEIVLRPILERIACASQFGTVHLWARKIARLFSDFPPVPESAHQLAHVIRVLALKRYIEGILSVTTIVATPGDIQRAWNWLLRSERIIASVSQENWREYLSAMRARLMTRVPRARTRALERSRRL